jgi:hypothetical protein
MILTGIPVPTSTLPLTVQYVMYVRHASFEAVHTWGGLGGTKPTVSLNLSISQSLNAHASGRMSAKTSEGQRHEMTEDLRDGDGGVDVRCLHAWMHARVCRAPGPAFPVPFQHNSDTHERASAPKRTLPAAAIHIRVQIRSR